MPSHQFAGTAGGSWMWMLDVPTQPQDPRANHNPVINATRDILDTDAISSFATRQASRPTRTHFRVHQRLNFRSDRGTRGKEEMGLEEHLSAAVPLHGRSTPSRHHRLDTPPGRSNHGKGQRQ